MAEEKSSKGFAKVFSKKVTRTREKVLLSMGKSDKTKDEAFDEHVTNFTKQQVAAAKIQVELKKYMSAVKNMSTASRGFYDALHAVYEEEWNGSADIAQAVRDLVTLWDNYTESIQTSVQSPLLDYASRFPDMKNRIAKRGRKLVDYDSARHHHKSLSNAKKRDETKIAKAQEELNASQNIYEEINTELSEELPATYESRIGFLSHNMHALFELEATFQSESAKIKEKMSAITDRLSSECGGDQMHYPIAGKVRPVFSKSQSKVEEEEEEEESDESDAESSKGMSFDLTASPTYINNPTSVDNSVSSSTPREQRISSNSDEDVYQHPENNKPLTPPAMSNGKPKLNGDEEDVGYVKRESSESGNVPEDTGTYENVDLPSQPNEEPAELPNEQPGTPQEEKPSPLPQARNSLDTPVVPNRDNPGDGDGDLKGAAGAGVALYSMAGPVDDIYTVPTSNESVELPEGVLYQVLATHPYSGDDTDELSFQTGEIINVVPYDDPDDQDDGWLMGYVSATGNRGVFPMNFTKKM